MRKISHMTSKKIAKTQKLPNFLDIRWRWGVFHCLELVRAWNDALLGEAEAKVRHLFATKHTFLEVDFNVVCDQAYCHTLLKVAICSS